MSDLFLKKSEMIYLPMVFQNGISSANFSTEIISLFAKISLLRFITSY